LSPQRGASSGYGWRKQPPATEDAVEYIELEFAGSIKVVGLWFGD
jgi:hypothetical protein